jgi:transcriptional regulator with XRE-family HTH domain
LFKILDKILIFGYYFDHMSAFKDATTVLERQLLLQLGDRLKHLRKAQGLTATALAERVGISRTTLGAVEAGDPAPAMGTYVRVMSALGVAADFALLASDALQPQPAGTAAARSRRVRPVVHVRVTADTAQHQVQDLQSLALHKEAIRLISGKPDLIAQAMETLERWRKAGGARSQGLWDEWATILAKRTWRKVLGRTLRAQELRQASPLPTVLPENVRHEVLAQVRALKAGYELNNQVEQAGDAIESGKS